MYNPLDGVLVVLRCKSPTEKLRDRTREQDLTPEFPGLTVFSDDFCTIWNQTHLPEADTKHSGDHAPTSSLWDATNRGYKYSPKLASKDFLSMRTWLNYVLVLNIREQDEINTILRCLESRSGAAHIPRWHSRQTYQLGHW
jgi:hypothetical protein